ncbi:MAG: DUF4266 domain-containing protein [Usitatibacter sp.]
MRLVAWALAAATLCLAACTTVAPYQRGYLAREDMALEGNPGFSKAIEKTFAAKEAASGGASVGGGGCGCN